MADDILPSPKKLKCRDGHEEQALRFQNAKQLTRPQTIVVQMLDHVKGNSRIKFPVSKGQSHAVRRNKMVELLRRAELQGFKGEIS